MKRSLGVLFAVSLFLAGAARSAAAQEMIHVELKNTGSKSIYIVAYDPLCNIKVFQGVLAEGSNRTVSICGTDRGKGSIFIYDRFGRRLGYTDLRNGSGIKISIRRSEL